MSEVDVLQTVIEVVHESMPGVSVGDTMPPLGELEDNLPAVIIDILPGQEVATAWGGNGFPVRLDGVSLDIEVMGRSRAQAYPIAARLRQVLHQLPHIDNTNVVSVDCPTFGTREDINLNIRALGVICDLTLHA